MLTKLNSITQKTKQPDNTCTN